MMIKELCRVVTDNEHVILIRAGYISKSDINEHVYIDATDFAIPIPSGIYKPIKMHAKNKVLIDANNGQGTEFVCDIESCYKIIGSSEYNSRFRHINDNEFLNEYNNAEMHYVFAGYIESEFLYIKPVVSRSHKFSKSDFVECIEWIQKMNIDKTFPVSRHLELWVANTIIHDQELFPINRIEDGCIIMNNSWINAEHDVAIVDSITHQVFPIISSSAVCDNEIIYQCPFSKKKEYDTSGKSKLVVEGGIPDINSKFYTI